MVFVPSDHVFYTTESMCYAALFVGLVFVMALTKNFIMDLLAYLFTAFFTQRIIIFYFLPENLCYQRALWFPPTQFTAALQILSLGAFAIVCGYVFIRIIFRNASPVDCSQTRSLSSLRILGRTVPFEALFQIYTVIAISLLLFQAFLMLQYGVGVTAVTFDRKFAIVYRISNFFTSLGFLGFVVLLSDVKGKSRRYAIWLIVFNVLNCLLRTSKGAIIGMMTQYLICFYFVRGYLPKRYIRYAVVGLGITMLLYAPLITLARYFGIHYATAGTMAGALDGVPWPNLFEVSGRSLDFMKRLGGFDWLLAAINVGRDAYPWYASLTGDLLMVLKTLYPGDALMFIQDYMPIAYVIPHLIYGWDFSVHYDQGELFGIAGMAYVYWGALLGALFYFIWISILLIIFRSRVHSVYKILLINYLMIDVFISGGFITAFCKIYEGVIVLGICYAIYMFRHVRVGQDVIAD